VTSLLPMSLALRRPAVSLCTTSRRLLSTKRYPPHRLMPMPRLSPSMRTGTLQRWIPSVGDEISSMNVMCEVATSELTEDPEDNGEDGVIILEVESHEEGYLAKILLPEGEAAECDIAIAIVCESDTDVPAFADYPTDRREVEPATFAWQAYLKNVPSKTCG